MVFVHRTMRIALVVLLWIAGYAVADDGPLVEMPLGKVRGHTLTSRSGREYMAFTGLPYAKPPVGELRFQPPQPASLWRGVWEAKDYGADCVQHNIFMPVAGSEDCLFLDVYTHNISGRAPVLVMFHGGAFYLGSKTMGMPTYLMDEDIVVVHANYRLGIFGFLTFETKDLAGNQGLKDQLMVLRWVKQNIGSFGGDPDSVTITGFSAGGASVHSHILSPLSRGLFHRAISTSGSMYNPWALSPPGLARTNAQKLMTLIGCPTEPAEAIPCVMEKDAQLIVDQFPKFYIYKNDPMLIFSPTLEESGSGGFLEGPISKWNHSPVPHMVILSSAEGLMKTKEYTKPADLHDVSTNFSQVVPVILQYWASASQPDVVTSKLKEYYFPRKSEITLDDLRNITDMYGDALFNYGVLKAANKHEGDVYFLWFDYVAPGTPEYELKLGAPHCGEMAFMYDFNLTLPLEPFKTEKSIEISQTFVKTIAQFMKEGTARVPGSNLIWKKWTAKDQNYLHLENTGDYTLKKGLIKGRYNFWDKVNFQDKFNL